VTIEDLQTQADRILRGQEAGEIKGAKLAALEEERSRFSPFIPSELARALDLADRLMAAAGPDGDDAGVAAALDLASQAAEREDLDLVRHALEIFITHNPAASRLAIPAVEPAPPRRRPAVSLADSEADPEAPLDWFREDPLANEHHRHWHVVYPGSGRPTPAGERALQDRQGELFFYMHEQMLARYDAERLALGLGRVAPFADYRAPIPETHGDRPPNRRLADVRRPDVGQLSIDELERQRKALEDALQARSFRAPDDSTVEMTTELLAAVEEPTMGTILPEHWHHGYGHVICAYAMSPTGGGDASDIGATRTAIRDPFFWRWHKHIDDFSESWQSTLEPHAFDDLPPVAVARDPSATVERAAAPGIILCLDRDLPGGGRADAEAAAFGRERFGDANWEAPASAADAAVDTLVTSMASTAFDPDGGNDRLVSHLDHEPFSYFLRLENQVDQPTQITVRIFLAPVSQAEGDRRAWIEMDKFEHSLEARERAVIHRPGRLASVVRKPAMRPPLFVEPPAQTPHEQYCRCGWPYHMLLPRGTREGMRFRLMVMATDGRADRVGGDDECGSLSFCGARDRYPDRREMGYPFNRPFPGRQSLTQRLGALSSVGFRELDIRFQG